MDIVAFKCHVICYVSAGIWIFIRFSMFVPDLFYVTLEDKSEGLLFAFEPEPIQVAKWSLDQPLCWVNWNVYLVVPQKPATIDRAV